MTKRNKVRSFAFGALFVVAAMIGLTVWAVSSPVGSDPDGSFHLNSIWCGQGTRVGLCEDPPPEQADTRPKTIMTPVGIAAAGQCFAFRALDSAACEASTIEAKNLVPNQFNNEGRLYPNGYYWVASHLVGDGIVRSAMLVRVFNILLLLGLLVLLRRVAQPAIFPATTLALLMTWVPFGLFLVASNNGSSWTLTGVGLFWAFFANALQSTERVKAALSWLGAAICAAMAVGSRVDGSIYIPIVACVVLLISWTNIPSQRMRVVGVAATALTGLVGAVTYLQSGQSGSLTAGLNAGASFGRSTMDVLWVNLFRLPGYFLGIYGISGFGSGLGWLDTPMEPLTWLLMIGAVAALVARSSRRLDWQNRLGVGLLIAACVAIPMYMFLLDGAIVGENIQSRYVLPLVTVLFAVFALQTVRTDNPWSLTTTSRVALTAAVTVAHAAALHINMRRYISGLDVWSPNLNKAREWWPTWLPSPNLCWIIGSLAMGVVTYLIFFREITTEKPVAAETES